MNTNLASLRRALFARRAMQSNGSSDNERARDSLNQAAVYMADEIPTAFVPDDEHVVLLPDINTSAVSTYIRPTSTDERTMQFMHYDATTGLYDFIDTAAGDWAPDVTGIWNGLMHLEITDSDGRVHRRQSREWWTETRSGNVYYLVSLDRPWPNTTDTPMAFRIHQPEFFVRADVKNILAPPRVYDSSRVVIGSMTQRDARTQDEEDFQGTYTGRPQRYWQTRHVQIPAPTEPAVTSTEPGSVGLGIPADPWLGPWQEGTFDFVYTYCWGLRDEEWQSSVLGIRDPLWESAPSPVVAFEHTGSTAGLAIRLAFTALDQEWGWYDAGGTLFRHGRGGYYVRIYGRRRAVRSAGLGTINAAETSNRYYLLGTIDPLTSATGYFQWNGSSPLDHSRPLVYSTGYYGYSVSPHQDARYELDLKVSRSTIELIDDQDVLPIRDGRPTAALLELAAHYHSLQDGVDNTAAALHLEKYNQLIREVRAQMTPVDTIMPARYAGNRTRRTSWIFTTP